MQFIYENFTFPPDQSFTIRSEFIEVKKYQAFRSHVNYEIALIENCSGKRFIGDHIADFEGTELVLMASYLPHCWQYYQTIEENIPAHAIIIHFFPDFLGADIYTKPEAKRLKQLFQDASKGILFSGETISKAKFIMQQMLFETGLVRSALLLQLLDLMSRSPTAKTLSSPGCNLIESSYEANNINNVFEYIFKNFRNEITLEEVAGIIPMSTSAFCRFFKSKTGRTLTAFIKEIRIGHASKLLLEQHYNVSEACYNSGYNNISNFNKHFKEVHGVSPTQFMNRYKMT
jgi:AraC-like DNA-binding protein